MKRLDMLSADMTQQQLHALRTLFPHCVTEAYDAHGQVTLKVDFDLLKQELSPVLIDAQQERYQLNWPGKRQAIVAANTPIAKTLRPVPAESIDFDNTQHLFIEGDNLDALKLLQETYLGKVKLIYIDPPYNTGNDFIYRDHFATDTDTYLKASGDRSQTGERLTANPESNGRFHSDWLSMMYPRLKLAHNLLREDGVLIMSIDESEHYNIIKLGEMIFGYENYCGEIIWKNSSKNDQNFVSIQHEYIVFFVKNKAVNLGNWLERKAGLEEIYKAFDEFHKKHGNDWEAIHKAAQKWFNQKSDSDPISDHKHYTWMDERGIYFAADISGPNAGQYVYEVLHPFTKIPCKAPASGWRFPKDKMNERISQNLIHFGSDHTTVPNNKTYLKDTEFQSLASIRIVDGRAASRRLQQLFGDKIFTNPKDEFLLKSLFMAVGVENDDLVLDFFAGSGTTMHAISELNKEQGSTCRCILVQLPEDLNTIYNHAKGSSKQVTLNAIKYLTTRNRPLNVAEITKERVRLSGAQILRDWQAAHHTPATQNYLTQTVPVAPDVGFRVLKIDSSNMHEVFYVPDRLVQGQLALLSDNIKPDRTSVDLLFQVMLDWGVELSLPIGRQHIGRHDVYTVAGNALVACFDTHIDEELVRELTHLQPLRVVFRDGGFVSDAVKINVGQIFAQLSPLTEVRVI